jgi:hypothetical protein
MPQHAAAVHSAPVTTVGLLLALGLVATTVLLASLIAVSVARPRRRPRELPSSGLASRVLHAEHGLGEEEFGRYFFLPTVREAWRQVCEADATGEGWTHPLIGDALDRIMWMSGGSAAPIEREQFAAVYGSLRRARLAGCAAAYERPLTEVG